MNRTNVADVAHLGGSHRDRPGPLVRSDQLLQIARTALALRAEGRRPQRVEVPLESRAGPSAPSPFDPRMGGGERVVADEHSSKSSRRA